MIDLEEFRKYLELDKKALDEAVTHQPVLFYQVSEALAQAIAERDDLKENVSVIDAEIDAEQRKKLDKAQIKFTEASIRSSVVTHKDHEQAFKAYIDAKERADKLTALKEAFLQRSYMIRELCALYVANFFEEGALRGTNTTDTATYRETRTRLKSAREKGNRG